MALLKGTLDVLVLKALSWGPMHGFEITSWLEERSRGRLEVSDAALLQALHRMEEQDLVTAEWGVTENDRRARYYTMTRGEGALVSAGSPLRSWITWARSAPCSRPSRTLNGRGLCVSRLMAMGTFLALSSCVTKTEEGKSKSRDGGMHADPGQVAMSAADTEVITGPGVPTALDDTLGTKYNKHQGPARTLPSPDCQPSGFALCITDTASVAWTYSAAVDGGMPDERTTDWLVFAAKQDSMQVFIARAAESYLGMWPPSAAGFVAEHAVNDASWIRARFAHAGTYVFRARIASDSVVSYELRVAPVIATGASRPIGKSATLMIEADSVQRVAIVPAVMLRGLDSDSAWGRFAVRPGPYRMLLVRDSAYVACRLPCRSPRPFIVHPAQTITIRP